MDLPALIQQCAPEVGARTITAIIRTESGGNPLALNVNGATRIARQPRNQREAVSWARWLIGQGYNVDLGLMQVNSSNLAHLELSIERAFDPCANIRAGSILLRQFYQRAQRQHGESPMALYSALSAYNTGSLTRGFANGYVSKVAGRPIAASPSTAKPPALRLVRPEPSREEPEVRLAQEAGTAIPAGPTRSASGGSGS